MFLNEAKNPVKLQLCISKNTDICTTPEAFINCASPSLDKNSIGVLRTPAYLQYVLMENKHKASRSRFHPYHLKFGLPNKNVKQPLKK